MKSSASRMVMVAGRGAVLEGTDTAADAATAAMAAFAGYEPHVSVVLNMFNHDFLDTIHKFEIDYIAYNYNPSY